MDTVREVSVSEILSDANDLYGSSLTKVGYESLLNLLDNLTSTTAESESQALGMSPSYYELTSLWTSSIPYGFLNRKGMNMVSVFKGYTDNRDDAEIHLVTTVFIEYFGKYFVVEGIILDSTDGIVIPEGLIGKTFNSKKAFGVYMKEYFESNGNKFIHSNVGHYSEYLNKNRDYEEIEAVFYGAYNPITSKEFNKLKELSTRDLDEYVDCIFNVHTYIESMNVEEKATNYFDF